MTAETQLLLPLDLPVDDVSFYRVGSWPSGAPSPELMRPRAAGLLRSLRDRFKEAPVPRKIIVTANRRVSVSYKLHRRERAFDVRAHWAVVQQEAVLLRAVGHVVQEGSFPTDFGTWLSELSDQLPGASGYSTTRALQPIGEHLDLNEILSSVAHLLPDPLAAGDVVIGWGRRSPRRKRRRVLRLGSCNVAERQIRIHPVLDDPRIPEYVVAQVVFHELCHYAAPPLSAAQAKETRDRRVHHRQFRALESRFPELNEANQWIERHIDRLIAAAS